VSSVGSELRKLPAFARRDLMGFLSYRTAVFADIGSVAVQLFTFSFVDRMIDPSALPTYGGQRIDYLDFVVVGMLFGAFLQVAMSQVVTAVRNEQLTGTLEILFMSPTSLATLQLGFAIYHLVYVPLRTAVFLLLITLFLDVDLAIGQLGLAVVILVGFLPFVWGVGIIGAGCILTFRRGAAALGGATLLLTISSGAFFPLDLLPGWLQAVAERNPMAIGLQAAREVLLGGAGWDAVADALVVLVPAGIAAYAAGSFAFRAALARERRLGTLGQY
jgi:ABC-2 type transport system permease protein